MTVPMLEQTLPRSIGTRCTWFAMLLAPVGLTALPSLIQSRWENVLGWLVPYDQPHNVMSQRFILGQPALAADWWQGTPLEWVWAFLVLGSLAIIGPHVAEQLAWRALAARAPLELTDGHYRSAPERIPNWGTDTPMVIDHLVRARLAGLALGLLPLYVFAWHIATTVERSPFHGPWIVVISAPWQYLPAVLLGLIVTVLAAPHRRTPLESAHSRRR
jgi:hypothetical protein